MKPLILFFLFITLLHGETRFTFPDAAHEAIRHLIAAVEGSRSELLFMTPHLEHYELKDALKQAARKGINVTLVTEGNDAGKQLALYANIDVRQSLEPLEMTLLLIDDFYCCSFKGSLKASTLEAQRGDLTCKRCDNTFSKFQLPESRSYLDY